MGFYFCSLQALLIFSSVLSMVHCASYMRPNWQYSMYTTTQSPDEWTTQVPPDQDTFENQQKLLRGGYSSISNSHFTIINPRTNRRVQISYEDLLKIMQSRSFDTNDRSFRPQSMKSDNYKQSRENEETTKSQPDKEHDIDNVDEIWNSILSNQKSRPSAGRQNPSRQENSFEKNPTILKKSQSPAAPSTVIFIVFNGQQPAIQPKFENPFASAENYERFPSFPGNSPNDFDEDQVNSVLNWNEPNIESDRANRFSFPIIPGTVPTKFNAKNNADVDSVERLLTTKIPSTTPSSAKKWSRKAGVNDVSPN